MSSFVRTRLWLVVLPLLLLGALVPQRSVQAQAPLPRTAFVHLFEWKWTDIARECENWLGPKGFAGVQISPPNEHLVIQSSPGNYPWWERYQPVSYSVDNSRSGTKAQLQDMITRCNNVGVAVYVDAVINHMTSGSGTGSNGSSYTKYNYPGTYSTWDFHYCTTPYSNRDIYDYTNNTSNNVRNCELSGLSDLNTSSDYVRGKIASYLIGLMNMGVKGFRFDAAKHMNPEDVGKYVGSDTNGIINRVNAAADAAGKARPYFFLEVIDKGGEAIHASDYFDVNAGNADIHEFKYGIELSKKFKSGRVMDLKTFGPSWGFMPTDKAVVFTDNHDEQRKAPFDWLTYKDSDVYNLGNVFELAWPYGYPQIMSSYAFSDHDQGPPSDASGNTTAVYNGSGVNTCQTANVPSSGWVCEHRRLSIANMVGFRNNTASTYQVTDWWDDAGAQGGNQVAFGRGDRGYVVINRTGSTFSRTFQTSLAAGTYCDVIVGDKSGTTCTGRTITVNAAGQATFSVSPMTAAAIHVGAQLSALPTVATSFNVNATTVSGQNVYVVGNVSGLGNWDPSKAVLLSSATYPTWRGTVNIPASTGVEYKYIKKDGAGNVIWEGGSNRLFTTPASGTATRNNSWQ